MIVLRDYQQKLVDDIREQMKTHRRVLAVSATGSGKTITFCYIANGATQKRRRVMIAVHRAEILDQISAALRAFDVPHGRIAPGYTPTDDLCQIGMIQTIANRLDLLPVPDLVTVDEAHHATSATYDRVLKAWASARSLGVTATPERLDGRGLGAQYDTMVLGPQNAELIEGGYLANFRYLAPDIGADTSGVRTLAGDYDRGGLASIMDKPVITGSAIAHYREYLDGAPTLVFCVNVAHAEHVAQQFRESGYRAASIDGKMDATERRTRLGGLASGALNVLTSCDLIGEGVDVPAVRGCVMLRRSKSLSLVMQQWGRALRLKPDGSPAVILDHVGNTTLHGTPRTHRDWVLTDAKCKQASPGVRQCKVCFRVFEPREAFDCERQGEKGCLLTMPTAPIDRTPAERAGVLREVCDTPEWSGGVSITAAKGAQWFRLLERAQTRDQLREIARARKYHPRWVDRILSERASRG